MHFTPIILLLTIKRKDDDLRKAQRHSSVASEMVSATTVSKPLRPKRAPKDNGKWRKEARRS